MEKRKNIIIKRDSQRQIALAVCFLILGGIALWAILPALEQVAGTQPEQKQERALVQQKSVRYRFRRIYHGNDVMTANHNTGGMPQASFRSTSSSIGAGGVSASSVAPSVRSSAPRGGVAVGSVGVLQSQQGIKSYVSGGGLGVGYSSGSSSSSGGVSVGTGASSYGGGYSVPALAALPSFGTGRTIAQNTVVLQEASATRTGGPAKRKITITGAWNDEEEEFDSDTWDADNSAANGSTHTYNGITYTKVDGVWQYEDIEGNVYVWNEGTGTFVLKETLPEADYPIGETPWLLMLLLAGGAAVWRMRSIRKAETNIEPDC